MDVMKMNHIEKAKILIDEALPYLHKFRGKVMVIKYGGKAMVNDLVKESVMKDVAFLKAVGIKPVIVHGGGPEVTREMEKLGAKPVFVNGLRVTDAETVEIIRKVFAKINDEIRAALKKMHCRSEALYDCMHVEQKDEKLGFVGEVKKVDVEKIKKMLDGGITSVISPLGTKDGQTYNINADSAAVKVAVALKAVKLTILTDVDGVMENGALIPHLSIAQARRLIKNGVITKGMIPKVEACMEAVEAGCRKAHLINGTVPHSLLFEIFTEEGIGTEVVGNER